MNTVEFPGCCGFLVINGFKGGHPGSDPGDCESKENVNLYLESKEQEYYAKRAGLICILSQPQQDRIGSVFDARKWVLLREINNCKTDTKVYIYLRDLNPTASREKRIFGK